MYGHPVEFRSSDFQHCICTLHHTQTSLRAYIVKRKVALMELANPQKQLNREQSDRSTSSFIIFHLPESEMSKLCQIWRKKYKAMSKSKRARPIVY